MIRDGGVNPATVAGRVPPERRRRGYRVARAGRPTGVPLVVARATGDAAVTVHASWNGATEVASWQVRGGPEPDRLTVRGEADRTGVETAVTVGGPIAFVAVDALDTDGGTLASSAVVAVGGHSGR